MDISSRLSISYYKEIATINESHKVFLVQHQKTGQIYIKKILDIYNKNVLQELSTSPVCGTPRIIKFCEDHDKLILIEEYISGTPLSEVIKNHSLTPAIITKILLQLCDTVASLHSLNPPIIHRDIKPTNIIITSFNYPVLIDFNAAKNYDTNSTNDTVLLGTQGYAAPEQYGFGSSSPQTDIYSLGILLKEMVDSLTEKTNMFGSIIEQCTQINPADRYQTVSALKNDLVSFCESNTTKKTRKHPINYLPPGFRTRTPWKMLLASLSYLMIFWLSLTMEIKDVSIASAWVERVTCLIMLLAIIAGTFDYCGIQQIMPICKHKNRMIRYIGIFILDTIFATITLVIMSIIFEFFP